MMLRSSLHVIRYRLQQAGRLYSTALRTLMPTMENSTEYCYSLNIVENFEHISAYRLLEPDGRLINSSALQIEKNFAVNLYKHMTATKEMDKILYECQRQGRISFYITSYGEEATVIGSAAGLSSDDLVFAQYRESGILLWRGFPIQQFVNQCFGNKDDISKGRNMPIHYGSKDLHFVTISSPLATQMPQAVGAAYAYKLAKKKRCVITYFGDGASSEGDAHAALNFAAVLECPIIFFCRNNGYAISTPTSEQFRGDGVASRAAGYGMPAIRVDGNDVFAVYDATRAAREYVINNSKPILLEAMTYRKGHHSTSDDSSAYRLEEENNKWDSLNPLNRMKNFLERNMWWNEDAERSWTIEIRNQFLNAVNKAETIKKPKWEEMFTDVYHDLPENLKEQKHHLEEHLKKFGQHYPMNSFEESSSI